MLAFLQPKPRDLRHSAGAFAACWEAEALVLVLPQSLEGQGTCCEGRQEVSLCTNFTPKLPTMTAGGG